MAGAGLRAEFCQALVSISIGMHRDWLPDGSRDLPQAPPHLLYLERASFRAYEKQHGPLFAGSKPGPVELAGSERGGANLAASSATQPLETHGDVEKFQAWRDEL